MTFLIIHGNHEARAESVGTYVSKEWNGGTVLYEEEYPDILFAVDGEVYQIGDKKAMVIGGAYRVDKSTEEWLSKIERKLTYEKWWFGHYHGNREYVNSYMLYEEIREIGENICVQRIGRPIYKKDEIVMFSYDNGKEQVEECGWIRVVDAKGTFGQSREVSYDIMTPEKGLYKHILESEIMGFKEQ